MPKFKPIQNSFAAGEISPLLHLRDDLDGYRFGCAKLLNMLPISKGPAVGRRGLEFLTEVPSTTYARLFTFEADDQDEYLVIVTPDFIYIADESGLLYDDNLVNDFDFDTPSNWVLATNGGNSSAQFGNSTLTLTHGAQADQWAEGQYIGLGSGITGAVASNNNLMRVVQATDEVINVRLGSTIGGNEYADFNISGTTAETNYAAPAATYYVTFRTTSPNQVIVLDKWYVFDTDATPGFVSFPSPAAYDAQTISELQAGMVPNRREMLFVTRNHLVQRLTFTGTPVVNAWNWDDMQWLTAGGSWPGGTGAVPPWGANSPGTITFLNSRVYLGGTIDEPGAFWASDVDPANLYRSFEGVLATADDNFIDADRLRNGSIVWMEAGKELFIGTSKGEEVATSIGPALTPTDISVKRNGWRGSSRVQTLGLEAKVYFVNQDQTAMFSFDYEEDSDSFVPSDISWMAEHFFIGNQVLEIAGIKGKDSVIAVPLNTGKTLICVNNQSVNSVGWSVMETEGVVVSVTALATIEGAQLFFLVLRNGKMFVERMSTKSAYLDAFHVEVADTPTNTFTGFDHLVGQFVSVVADGGYLGDNFFVESDGTIILPGDFTTCIAGLPYTQRIDTLPYASRGQRGTTRGDMKADSKVYVGVYESNMPKINGKRPPDRAMTTVMDQAQEGATGYVRVSTLGRDRINAVTVEQDLPFNLTVTGIFRETDLSEL